MTATFGLSEWPALPILLIILLEEFTTAFRRLAEYGLMWALAGEGCSKTSARGDCVLVKRYPSCLMLRCVCVSCMPRHACSAMPTRLFEDAPCQNKCVSFAAVQLYNISVYGKYPYRYLSDCSNL